jgi:hypothetical protein
MDGHYLCPGPLNDDTGGVEMIGLLFLLFIFLYLLFGYFLYGYIRGWGPGKRKALIITLVIMLGVPFGDVIPGKLYLYYICHKDGGIKINEVVHTTGYLALDGYSYGCGQGCIQKLLEWNRLGKPMFIETFVDTPKEYNFVDKPGYYRFELVERSPEKCALHDSLRVKYPIRFRSHETAGGYCLSAIAIDHTTANYSVKLSAHDYHVSDLLGIISDNAYIRRIADGNIISSATRFTYLGGWVQRSFSNILSGGIGEQCPSGLSHGFRSELMELTFKNTS